MDNNYLRALESLMPILSFPFGVTPGIVRSIEPYRLPGSVWSDGLNMLFRDNNAEKAFGFATYIDTPTINPKAIFFTPLNNVSFWAYPGFASIYAFDSSGTKADITGSALTGDSTNLWTFAYLHGIAIFNNGADVPQFWIPSLGNNCADLTNWHASTTTCRTMRSFLQYLIALDVDKNGTRSPQMIKWSHGAAAGAVPSSWDETDTTVDAGEFLASATPGICIDCLPLGNTNIIYKEDSILGMTFIGGSLVFGFPPLFDDMGILARDCAVAFGRKHFVVTNEDIVVHNGIQASSIVDARNRKWFFDNLSEAGRSNTFCVNVRHRSEIWTFFPMTGAGATNMMMIYNYAQQSTTFREIPHVRHASYAPAMRSITDDSFDGNTAGNLVETIDNAAAVDKGGGEVGIPITGHGLTVGALVDIAGTTNYNQTGIAINSATANEIVITDTYNAETFGGSETVTETDTFDYESTIIFDKVQETTLQPHFHFINEDDDDIEEFDETIYQDVGVNKRSYLERKSMAFIGQSNGQEVVDTQQMKMFTELWPHIIGVAGVQVEVFFGTQDFPDQEITWYPSVLYVIGTTEVIPIHQTGRFLSVRFEATGNNSWEHHGFDYEVLPLGRY